MAVEHQGNTGTQKAQRHLGLEATNVGRVDAPEACAAEEAVFLKTSFPVALSDDSHDGRLAGRNPAPDPCR
jgi:hypothetical protein